VAGRYAAAGRALRRGRRLIPGRVRVGIDLGGTKLLAVALDGDGQVVAHRKLDVPGGGRGLADTVSTVASELGGHRPAAVGIGVPGLVDGGRLVFSPHRPGLVGVDIRSEVAARLPHASVWVGNDADCAGWAEQADGGPSDLLMVTLGTGIGGAIIAGGRLQTGAHGFAGEIGHMVVVAGGPLCACGQRGCWEQVASGAALGRLGRKRAEEGRAPALAAAAGGADLVRGEHVTAAAAGGDPDAVETMVEYAGWLALGLANLTNVLDPRAVIIGGGLAEAGEVLMAPLRAAFARLVEGFTFRRDLDLGAARLGERAGATGAALLAGDVAI
jgi:glucokinase